MLTPQQLKERLDYIGSSDAPAVLGISRWKTPLQVWAEKSRNVEPEDISDRLPVKLGNRLEQVVAELFTEKTGMKVRRVNETIYHPTYRFLAANLDRRIVGSNAILEAKTCSPWKAKEWAGEEIPQEYVCQVMHALGVTGMKVGYLAVLIGNQDFIVKTIERDEQVIAEMVKKEVHFWRTYVEPRVMPMIITTDDADTLYTLFPMGDSPEITLGDEVDLLIENRSAMIADLKGLESQLERTDNEIKAMLKDASVAKTQKNIISWKRQTSKRVDTKLLEAEMPDIHAKFIKESASRVLRIRAIKE